jgi:hypothetical protein
LAFILTLGRCWGRTATIVVVVDGMAATSPGRGAAAISRSGGVLTLPDVVVGGGKPSDSEERGDLRKRPKILDGLGVELIVVIDVLFEQGKLEK